MEDAQTAQLSTLNNLTKELQAIKDKDNQSVDLTGKVTNLETQIKMLKSVLEDMKTSDVDAVKDDLNRLQQELNSVKATTTKNASTIAIKQMDMPLPVPPSSSQQGTMSTAPTVLTQQASMSTDVAEQIAELSQKIADSSTLTPELKQEINSILSKLDKTDPHTKELVGLLENISQKVDVCLSTVAQQSVDPTSTELNKKLDEQLNNAVNDAKNYAEQAKQHANQPVSQPIQDNSEALKMAQEAKDEVDELKKQVTRCCADNEQKSSPELDDLKRQVGKLQDAVDRLKQRASTPQPVQTPDPGLANRLSRLEDKVNRDSSSVPSSVTNKLAQLEADIKKATVSTQQPLQPPQATPQQLYKIKKDIEDTVMAELDKNKINATTVNQGLTKIDQLFQDMNNNRYLTKDELNVKVNELSGQFADLEKIKKALRVLLEDSIYHHGEQPRGLPIAFSY